MYDDGAGSSSIALIHLPAEKRKRSKNNKSVKFSPVKEKKMLASYLTANLMFVTVNMHVSFNPISQFHNTHQIFIVSAYQWFHTNIR